MTPAEESPNLEKQSITEGVDQLAAAGMHALKAAAFLHFVASNVHHSTAPVVETAVGFICLNKFFVLKRSMT